MTGKPATARVVLATETYWPEIGGGERQARSLAARFGALGREVTILTRRSRPGSPRSEMDGSARVVRLPPGGRGRWRKWLMVFPACAALCLRRGQYDAVLVSGFRILGIAALIARAFTRRPTVLKADSRGELSGEYFRAGLADAGLAPESAAVSVALRFRNALLRRADAFIALSDEMAREFLENGVPAARIRKIPNGVDTDVFRPASPEERSSLRRKLGLPPAPVAVYTGRLVTYKGLPSLLRAWRNVPDACLVLVGEGGGDLRSCERELREFVTAHGLQARVRFAGPVEQVDDWLRAADLYVFPTEDEAFGLALVEAMACALPCVTTRVGGLRDFVVDGVNAVAVPPGDEAALAAACGTLIADEKQRAALGAAARRTAVERFGLASITAAYGALLDELLPGAERATA
ncbi:MAG TPA: glycosyltransferase family 4 protein [Steroidobacteraceae bacterium]|nr:glycosyltransferase family 4 protein [Steroidobacteraceae bacterium]